MSCPTLPRSLGWLRGSDWKGGRLDPSRQRLAGQWLTDEDTKYRAFVYAVCQLRGVMSSAGCARVTRPQTRTTTSTVIPQIIGGTTFGLTQ
eukprot:7638664-Pyramimonas_sp.AAC.1